MTISEAVTTAIGEASTDIVKMIEELTQPGDPEVPITDIGGLPRVQWMWWRSLPCSEILERDCHLLLLNQV